jgi:hypothetical protein
VFGLFLLTLVFVGWSLVETVGNSWYFYYAPDGNRTQNVTRAQQLHVQLTLDALIPMFISNLVWILTAVLLWRALRKQQQAQPVIRLDPQLGTMFRHETALFDSTDVKPQ